MKLLGDSRCDVRHYSRDALQSGAACGHHGHHSGSGHFVLWLDTWGLWWQFSHPSTNQARPCLASEIRWDRARSGWYGRRPLMTILQEGVTTPPFYKGGTEAQRTLVQVLTTHRWWNQPLDPPKPKLTHLVQAVSLEARCSQSNPNGKCHIHAHSSWRGPPALLLNILILSTGSNQPGDLVLSD